MKRLVRRLALIAALLSQLPTRCAVRGDEVDIILRSTGSMHSGSSVKGLSIDLINGSTASLEAVYLKNVSASTMIALEWHKDGKIVRAPLVMRRIICQGNKPSVLCSLNLSISEINDTKSGNYSLKMQLVETMKMQAPNNFSTVASVNIVFGDAQAISFTDSPTDGVNCSSENSSVALSYAAVGFPTPMYKLTCRGWQYTSEPSTKGKFIIPPEVCCAGAACRATAFNEYEEVRSKDVIVRETPVGPICQQHVGCLSPRLEVYAKSCMSAESGNVVNGRAVSIADDDSTAALEAIAYRNISSFVQLRLAWSKDGHLINTSLNAHCDGKSGWGSWMFCRLRLPISALSGNRSGNYTVTLHTTRLVASAWVVVTVSGQGSQNCSSNSDSLASPSVLPTFPFTCGPYSDTPTPAIDNNGSVTVDAMQIIAMAVTAGPSLSNNVLLAVITVTLGVIVVAAILAYVVCKRAGSLYKRITRKYSRVPRKNQYYNNYFICNSDPSSSAALADSHFDRVCTEHSRDAGSLGGLLLQQTAPLQWTGTLANAADVEIDGVVTSVMAESASHNDSSSQPSAFAREQCIDQQPPASAERGVVHDASTNAVESEVRPSITLIIHAENVQVGANNMMFIQQTPCSSSSAADSAYESTQDTDSSSSSSPGFDECCSARVSADLLLPESDFSSQVEQQSWSGSGC